MVTGASSEIGATMADALAAEGAAVVATFNETPGLAQEVAERIVAEGGRALALQADLSRVAENQRVVERTVAEFGRLDVFVANAGVTLRAPFLEMEEDVWDTLVDLNLKGAYFGAQAAARQMVAQRDREARRRLRRSDRALVVGERARRDRATSRPTPRRRRPCATSRACSHSSSASTGSPSTRSGSVRR